MIRFPDEAQRSAEVQRMFAALFQLADEMCNFWLEYPKNEWTQKARLPAHVLNVAGSLDVQACRFFRSMVEDCRRCEAMSARINARSLFETMLALEFVLAERVGIKAGERDRKPQAL